MDINDLTPVQKDAAIKMLQTIRAIRDAVMDLGTVPSGELYAQLMGYMSLETYQFIVGAMSGAGLIQVKNNVITWTGGKP